MAVAFDAVGPAGGGGAKSTTSPLTWSHTNSAAGNAFLVGVNYHVGSSPQTSAVTYGGVALSRLGTITSGAGGGVELWGVIGGLPTGANTVSVTFTVDSGDNTTGGSVSLTGASSFSAAQTSAPGSAATSVTYNFTGTTSGNMIVAAASFGNSGATFSTTSPGTQRWAVVGDSNTASDNSVGGTWSSPGGTQAVGFSETGAVADWWALAAVEVQAAAAAAAGGGGAAQPGQTWLRRFHHRQILPQPPAAVVTLGTRGPAMPPMTWMGGPGVRPARARARLGPRGLCAAGIAVASVVAAQPAAPVRLPAPVTRPAPARARLGPMGRSAGGIAVTVPRGTPGPLWRPQPRRPAPARATWHGGAGPQPAPAVAASAVRRPPAVFPRRTATRVTWHGYGSPVITPRGTPGPLWRPQPRRPAPARAVWHGNAGPAAVAPAAPQAYQRPPVQIRRPAPRRALWHGNAGPQPAAAAFVSHPPLPLPRSRPGRRAVWHGNAPAVVTPLGTPARRPGPQITSRARTRVTWHGNAGPQPVTPPVAVPPPRWRPLPLRRKPARAVTRGGHGLVNLPFVPTLQNATSAPSVTARDTSTATVTGTASGAQVAARDTSAPGVTSRPGGATVTSKGSSSPAVSDG